MTRIILSLVLVGLLGSPAFSKPRELVGLVSAAKPVGCSEYSYLFWDLYRAELWSDASALPGSKFGLSLTYRTDFSRETLVQSSVEELARMSGASKNAFTAIRNEMNRAFRSVKTGDRITAWRDPAGFVRLFHNGKETGQIRSGADAFMDIWLGPKSRDRKGRRALLSGRCDG